MKTTKTKELKNFTYVSDWAKDLLEKVPEEFTLEEKEFKTVALKELGFTKGIETREFLNNEFLEKHGLALCESTDVFQIAKTLKNKWVWVGMEPIVDRDGDPHVFRLHADDAGLKLYGDYAEPDGRWDSGYRFVFLIKTKRKQTEILDRLFAKVDKTENCWNWKGAKRDGYGRIGKGKRGEGILATHRVVYEALVGEIPKGMVIDHLCRNRACVNPKHLETVTSKENILRGEGAPAKNARKINCIKGHLLSGENLYELKGKRYCKLCQKEYKKLSPQNSDSLNLPSDTLDLELQNAILKCKDAGYKVIKEL